MLAQLPHKICFAHCFNIGSVFIRLRLVHFLSVLFLHCLMLDRVDEQKDLNLIKRMAFGVKPSIFELNGSV